MISMNKNGTLGYEITWETPLKKHKEIKIKNKKEWLVAGKLLLVTVLVIIREFGATLALQLSGDQNIRPHQKSRRRCLNSWLENK